MSSKGEQTRNAIVSQAVETVAREGFAGLSIGGLARDLGLSKSGLFAHFRNKDHLQLQVLEAAKARFVQVVVLPAIEEPRGAPRIHALFANWLRYAAEDDTIRGGCIFVGAAAELDDQPGPLRDAAVDAQRDWIATLAKAASLAVDEGHLHAELDCEQFAFAAYSILLGRHLYSRFLDHPRAREFTVTSLQNLLRRASAGAPDPQPLPELA